MTADFNSHKKTKAKIHRKHSKQAAFIDYEW